MPTAMTAQPVVFTHDGGVFVASLEADGKSGSIWAMDRKAHDLTEATITDEMRAKRYRPGQLGEMSFEAQDARWKKIEDAAIAACGGGERARWRHRHAAGVSVEGETAAYVAGWIPADAMGRESTPCLDPQRAYRIAEAREIYAAVAPGEAGSLGSILTRAEERIEETTKRGRDVAAPTL